MEAMIMTRIIMHGCNGHMGRVITDLVSKDDECKIVQLRKQQKARQIHAARPEHRCRDRKYLFG